MDQGRKNPRGPYARNSPSIVQTDMNRLLGEAVFCTVKAGANPKGDPRSWASVPRQTPAWTIDRSAIVHLQKAALL